MRQILEKTSEYVISMFHLFIDFKVACDTIRREKLLEALNEFQMQLMIVRLIKLTLKHMRCRLKIQNNVLEQFETSVGLRHGVLCLVYFLTWRWRR
jgi:hypothetical protein